MLLLLSTREGRLEKQRVATLH